MDVSSELDVEYIDDSAEVNTITSDSSAIYVSQCQPIILTFNNTNSSFFNSNTNTTTTSFPICFFYNETTREYESEGCFLIEYTSEYSRCSCIHLTYFGVGHEDFEPEINFYTIDHWRSINVENLILYPLGWIVASTWIFVCVTLILLLKWNQKSVKKGHHGSDGCCSRCYKDDKPLIARLDVFNNMQLLSRQEKLKYKSIIVLEWLKQSSENEDVSLFKQWFGLCRINCVNDHIWIGVCMRNYGTSYTHAQRISILMVRLLSTMCIAALFFGRAKDTVIGDISLTLYESFLGFLPMYFLQKWITQHKPGIRKHNEKELAQWGVMPNLSAIKSASVGNSEKSQITSPSSESKLSPAHYVAGKRQISIDDGSNEQQTKENIRRLANVSDGRRATTFDQNGDNNNDLNSLPTNKLMMLLNQASQEDVMEQVLRKSSSLRETQAEMTKVKIELIHAIQERLFNETYKLPYCCKYVTICLIIIWSLLCAVITSLWCLWFEVENIDFINEYENNITNLNCSQSVYGSISLKTWLNYNLTVSAIDNILLSSVNDDNFYNVYNPPSGDSFGDSLDVSTRFLISVCISYFLSVFLWQPLIIGIKSFLTLINYLKNPNKVNEALLFYQQPTIKYPKFANVQMSKQRQGFKKNDGNLSDDDDILYLSDNDKNEMVGVNLQLRGARRVASGQSQASAMTLPDLPPDSSNNVNSIDTPGNDKISNEIMDLIKNDIDMPDEAPAVAPISTRVSFDNSHNVSPNDTVEQAQEGWVGETGRNDNNNNNNDIDVRRLSRAISSKNVEKNKKTSKKNENQNDTDDDKDEDDNELELVYAQAFRVKSDGEKDREGGEEGGPGSDSQLQGHDNFAD